MAVPNDGRNSPWRGRLEGAWIRRRRFSSASQEYQTSYQNPREMSASRTVELHRVPRLPSVHPRLVPVRYLSILRRTVAFNEGKLKMRRNARPVALLTNARGNVPDEIITNITWPSTACLNIDGRNHRFRMQRGARDPTSAYESNRVDARAMDKCRAI